MPHASPLRSLRARRDFVNAHRRGRRHVTPSFILQMQPHEMSGIGLGLTASKKLGRAVARNRARRRLRALARAILPQRGRAAHAYVLVARKPILTRPWQDCLQDLQAALRRVHASPPQVRAPQVQPPHRKRSDAAR